MFVDTKGRRWSSERITTRPFGSVYFSNLIVGAVFDAAVSEAEVLGFAGAFFGVFWPDVVTAATATENARINRRLHNAEVIPILLGHGCNNYLDAESTNKASSRSRDYTIPLRTRVPGIPAHSALPAET